MGRIELRNDKNEKHEKHENYEIPRTKNNMLFFRVTPNPFLAFAWIGRRPLLFSMGPLGTSLSLEPCGIRMRCRGLSDELLPERGGKAYVADLGRRARSPTKPG